MNSHQPQTSVTIGSLGKPGSAFVQWNPLLNPRPAPPAKLTQGQGSNEASPILSASAEALLLSATSAQAALGSNPAKRERITSFDQGPSGFEGEHSNEHSMMSRFQSFHILAAS